MISRGEFVTSLFAAGLLSGCRGFTDGRSRLKMSEFSVYIAWAAERYGVAEEAVAHEMIAHGIAGLDAEYVEYDRVHRLSDVGMALASMYGSVHFLSKDRCLRETEAFLSSAKRCKAVQLMVIPDDFPEGVERRRALDDIVVGLSEFVIKANREGLAVNVESFGSAASPCSRIASMKVLFDAIPALGFTLDTGNFFHAGNGCGDDILEAFRVFRDRIRHVHLKDRPANAPRGYAPLGQGVIPNERVVRTLLKDGFPGWFTFEEAGAEDVAKATYDAAEVLESWARMCNCDLKGDT